MIHKVNEAGSVGHRRNHHTTIKNQKTTARKTMYHSQRQPCRSAMLFILRNVPLRIPDVSENASFYPTLSATFSTTITKAAHVPSAKAAQWTRAPRSQCQS